MGILMSSTAFQRKMAIFFVNSHVFYTISEEKWQLSIHAKKTAKHLGSPRAHPHHLVAAGSTAHRCSAIGIKMAYIHDIQVKTPNTAA